MISLCLLVLQILITWSVLFWAMHLKCVLNPPCTQGHSWFSGRVYGFTVEPINGRHAYIPFPVSFFLVGNFLSSLIMSGSLCELYVCVCGFAQMSNRPLNIWPVLHIACCTYWSRNMINESVSDYKFLFKISFNDKWVFSTGAGAYWFYYWQLTSNIIWTCLLILCLQCSIEKQSKVMINDMMWAKL